MKVNFMKALFSAIEILFKRCRNPVCFKAISDKSNHLEIKTEERIKSY